MYGEILTLRESIVASVFIMIIILLTLYVITLVLECISKAMFRPEKRESAVVQLVEEEGAESDDELAAVIMAAAMAVMDHEDLIEAVYFKECGKQTGWEFFGRQRMNSEQ